MAERKTFSTSGNEWRIPSTIAALGIVIPNGLLRLAPLGRDIAVLVKHHGWAATLRRILPRYGEALLDAYGSRLWLCPLGLAIAFGFAWLAARAASILITKAVLRLGFRLEASGESHLLHPDEER